MENGLDSINSTISILNVPILTIFIYLSFYFKIEAT